MVLKFFDCFLYSLNGGEQGAGVPIISLKARNHYAAWFIRQLLKGFLWLFHFSNFSNTHDVHSSQGWLRHVRPFDSYSLVVVILRDYDFFFTRAIL